LKDTTYAIATGLAVIWLFTWINSKPLKTVAIVQIVTTVLKVTPIFLIAIFGFFFIESGNFRVPNLSGESDFSSITITTTATLFAFLGMESATITSSKIENAQTIIRNSTIIGTLFTIVIYITSSVVIMGIIPQGDLVNSNAPFADVAALFWGDLAKYIVAGGAVVATLGALNGWILIQGQVPMAAANDNLFPKLFGKTNKNDSPIIGIILSSSLASLVMGLNFSDGLVQAFTFMMNLSTLSVLTPYLLSSISLIVLIKSLQGDYLKEKIISYLAIIFCVWVIFGSGIKVILWGLFLLILGIPLYFLLNKEKSQNTK
jgi:APA family basic amino acid/polyamine antiporter